MPLSFHQLPVLYHLMRAATVSPYLATLARSNSLDAFLPDDRHHHQGRDRVCPPPSDQGIQQHPRQSDDREISAERGLPGFCLERPTRERAGNGLLLPRQER